MYMRIPFGFCPCGRGATCDHAYDGTRPSALTEIKRRSAPANRSSILPFVVAEVLSGNPVPVQLSYATSVALLSISSLNVVPRRL